MSQPSDLTKIRGLVAHARTRIRTQGALEGATTALVLAATAAAATIFAIRSQMVGTGVGVGLLIGSAMIIVAGALIGALRKLDDERVARRIDRASNLSDRLSTAISFDRALATDKTLDDDHRDFMTAAIRDAARAAPRANVVAATPYTTPKDLKLAAVFVVVAALVAMLRIPLTEYKPGLTGVTPLFAPPGAEVTLHGKNLTVGVKRRPITASVSAQAGTVLGVAGATAEAEPLVPANVNVYLGVVVNGTSVSGGIPLEIERWTKDTIVVRLPADAPFGKTTLTAFIASKPTNQVDFEVVDPRDKAFHKEDAAELDDDEMAYARSLIEELRRQAKQDQVQELDDFAAKIEKLLDQAEKGEISKEQLLEEMSKADEQMQKGDEPDPEEVDKALEETGKELGKNNETKDLGKALEKGDLDKAKEEMQKLADKLEKGEMSDKQKEDLSKALDKAAKAFDKKQDQQDQQDKQAKDKMEQDVRKLEKERDQAKTDQEKQDAERRLEKKERELKKLEKDQQDKQDSNQRRALKRLHKDMEKAAEDLQKKKDPNQDKDQQDQQDQQQQQQASQKLKDAAEETGKVSNDKRKQASQKKMASQMEDLREAMRRAKRRGSKGANDPFGKNGKNKDFISRARGQGGNGKAWQPGQGKGQGQDGNDPNGGGGQGGQQYGTGHDNNLTGDPTKKDGGTKDQQLSGEQGKGSSRRETILSAAQKGFATKSYETIYTDYKKIVEEVMRTEKVPSSYKYYVKRYFTKIKPN